MKKRLFALFLAIVFCLSLCFSAYAVESDTDVSGEEVSETVIEGASEKEDGTSKYFQVYILAGSVIGAMVIVTLLYKKKDEIRYL